MIFRGVRGFAYKALIGSEFDLTRPVLLRCFNYKTMQDKQQYREIKEGAAKILFKEEKEAKDEEGKAVVFYNPVQEFNRDLSILALRAYISMKQQEMKKDKKFEGISVLQALSATGLRSVRYLKEVEGIRTLLANDILPDAVELIRLNFKNNGLVKEGWDANLGDANELMFMKSFSGQFFDCIDLDPYGSAQPFMEGALRSISNQGGLLCVTYTDAAVLCGKYIDTCYYKYGTVAVTKPYCHEMGLRIALYSISSQASKLNRYIVPLLSVSTDFYFRLFVRVYEGKTQCKKAGLSYSYWAQCVNCQHFHVLPRLIQKKEGNKIIAANLTTAQKCEVCQSRMVVYGPIWGGPLHSLPFIESLIQQSAQELTTIKKIKGMLSSIKEEYTTLGEQNIFGFDVPLGCKELSCSHPSKELLYSAFQSLDIPIVQAYMKPSLYKTTATPREFYDILKSWKRTEIAEQLQKDATKEENKEQVKIDEKIISDRLFKNIKPDSYKFVIMSLPQTLSGNFSEVNAETKKAIRKSKRVPKFFPNPKPNWGPQSRAVGKRGAKTLEDSQVEPEIGKKKK